MDFLSKLKERIPDYAKDVRLNLDGAIARSSLASDEAVGVALAAAFAARSPFIINTIRNSGQLDAQHVQAALTAAALMGMNNVWYPFVEMTGDSELRTVPAQLRMNAYANHADIEPRVFEMFALAASIVGKCTYCVASHYALLKKGGMDLTQLRDIGRIAAVVQAAALVISAEESV